MANPHLYAILFSDRGAECPSDGGRPREVVETYRPLVDAVRRGQQAGQFGSRSPTATSGRCGHWWRGGGRVRSRPRGSRRCRDPRGACAMPSGGLGGAPGGWLGAARGWRPTQTCARKLISLQW
ncbi:hypothetical protein [Streptomyces caniscabiei]|uniref:hypothetical protein n=1 Tax=Streptomyces caniscabiei TaxID=2746961 RepID=UPI0038D4E136